MGLIEKALKEGGMPLLIQKTEYLFYFSIKSIVGRGV